MLAKVAQSADTIKPNATFLQSKAIQNCGTGSRRRGLTGALGFLGEECLVRCFFFACLWREGLSATTTTESVSASKASTAAWATGGGGVVSLSLTTAVTSSSTTMNDNRTIVPRRSRLVMSKKPFFIVYYCSGCEYQHKSSQNHPAVKLDFVSFFILQQFSIHFSRQKKFGIRKMITFAL